MNVSLDGARSQARLDWDALEARNSRARSMPRRIFACVVALFVAYALWGQFTG